MRISDWSSDVCSSDLLARLPLVAPNGVQLTLGQVVELSYTTGPPMLKSDNGQLTSYVYVDVDGRDLGSVVEDLQRAVAEQMELPAGYSLAWTGQYEYLRSDEHTSELQSLMRL